MFTDTRKQASKAIQDVKVSLNVGVIIASVSLLIATVALVVAVRAK